MNPILSPNQLATLAASLPTSEMFGPGSACPVLVIHLAGADPALGAWLGTLPCPVIGIGFGPLAPVCDMVLANGDAIGRIGANIAAAPIAAMVLVQLLRCTDTLPLAAALDAESFAYGTVQRGPEFLRWREQAKRPTVPLASNTSPILLEADDDAITITLTRAEARNEIDVAMRDALTEALDFALADPLVRPVRLHAQGACFSTGGAVHEFGSASDPATAHWIRTLRLPARRLALIGPRLHIQVRGAAIGAGIEIAAFAGRLTASRDAWFQLPELRYGLIPGAGGTVSIARRIGRQRTAYMALSMRRIPASLALDWGLVDAIES